MMEVAGTWVTLCGFFSPAMTPVALGTLLCSALLPLLSRASSASITLQSPGRGKSCLCGLALEEAVVVMEPQWWTQISCTLEFRKAIHKHPKTKLATGLQLAGNNRRDLSVYNQVCLAWFSKLFKG